MIVQKLRCIRARAELSAYPEQFMQIQPYLFFEGRCEEALNFYRDALGAQD